MSVSETLHRHRPRRRATLILLGGGLTAAVLAGTGIGAMAISPFEVLAAIAERLGLPVAASPVNDAVIWAIRIPRVALAALTGAALAVTGALYQGMLRNPLADPALIGISAGAGVGACIGIVLGAGLPAAGLASGWVVPLCAFAGAAVTTVLVHGLSTVDRLTSLTTLLLAGIAMNAVGFAVIGFLQTVADDAQLRDITFWMLGSLGGATWPGVLLAAVCVAPLLASVPRMAGALNALALGEEEAAHLGVPVQRVKLEIVALTALAVGVSVALTGIINFVGLVAPHLVRLLIGANHRWVLPGSALLGAILVVLSDLLARTVAAPAELPVGVVTALLGAPFFLGLLLHRRRRLA